MPGVQSDRPRSRHHLLAPTQLGAPRVRESKLVRSFFGSRRLRGLSYSLTDWESISSYENSRLRASERSEAADLDAARATAALLWRISRRYPLPKIVLFG